MWRRRFLWLVRRGSSKLPALLVLTGLVGLMYWGHHAHWQVPHFASLWGGEVDMVPTLPATAKVDSLTTGAVRYRIQLASESAVDKVGIATTALRERPMTHAIAANGVIDFDQTVYAEVSSRAGGIVWAVFKKEGDAVEKGDVLALVASADVVKTKADFLQALLELEAKEGVLKRMQATADVVAGRQLREAERALREARIRLFELQQRLSNLGLTVHSQALLATAEDQVVERLRTAGIPTTALRDLDRDTLPNSLLPLFAPLRGQVVKRDSMVGELITSDQVQFVVVDTKRLWLLLDVRLEDAHLLALEQQVVFQPDGSSAVAHGHISWIRPGVDQKTRTVRVRADVDSSSGALRPNTFGTGRIIVRPSYPALAVPTAAIQREGEQRLVFVQVGGNVFEGRRIEPGVRDAGFTEIRSGLRSGDAVVIAGSHVLKSEILRSRLANP